MQIEGTILQLNRDNSGHISLLLPNLSPSTSYQTMKISKIGTNRDQKEKNDTEMYENASVPIFSTKYSKFGTK